MNVYKRRQSKMVIDQVSTKTIFYAGIGSRETPPDIIASMKELARVLATRGYTLRSGGAKGADKAFEEGCDKIAGKKEIFRAEDAIEEALQHALEFHPNWKACSPYAKQLHARNSMIVLGERLDTPVDFIICWTIGGEITGGTGQAMRIAIAYKIPVYNLALTEDYISLLKTKLANNV